MERKNAFGSHRARVDFLWCAVILNECLRNAEYPLINDVLWDNAKWVFEDAIKSIAYVVLHPHHTSHAEADTRHGKRSPYLILAKAAEYYVVISSLLCIKCRTRSGWKAVGSCSC